MKAKKSPYLVEFDLSAPRAASSRPFIGQKVPENCDRAGHYWAVIEVAGNPTLRDFDAHSPL
jgi:hypothetical protein